VLLIHSHPSITCDILKLFAKMGWIYEHRIGFMSMRIISKYRKLHNCWCYSVVIYCFCWYVNVGSSKYGDTYNSLVFFISVKWVRVQTFVGTCAGQLMFLVWQGGILRWWKVLWWGKLLQSADSCSSCWEYKIHENTQYKILWELFLLN